MLAGGLGGDPALGRAVEEREPEEERLVDVLDRLDLLGQDRGQRLDADRPRGELLDDRGEELAVGRVEALLVDLHPAHRLLGRSSVDPAVAVDLGEVADALEQPVDDPRRARARAGRWPPPPSASMSTSRMPAERRTIADEVGLVVEVEAIGRPEPVAERRADPARPGRRADDRERLEAEPERPRRRDPCRSSRRARSPPSPGRGSPRPRG